MTPACRDSKYTVKALPGSPGGAFVVDAGFQLYTGAAIFVHHSSLLNYDRCLWQNILLDILRNRKYLEVIMALMRMGGRMQSIRRATLERRGETVSTGKYPSRGGRKMLTTSMDHMVGIGMGGAVIGAALGGGPIGAFIGGIIGAIIGSGFGFRK